LTQSKPHITGTTHTLPFDRLSPREFERLCLWLVKREGYERAEHPGAAGSEQGRDIIAWHDGELWAFQCKRVRSFGPNDALKEVEKILALPEGERPVGLVFIVTCDVSANTRQQVHGQCAGEMECSFWAGTELDEKVKQHRDIVEEFFRVSTIGHVTRIGRIIVQFVDERVLKRQSLEQRAGLALLGFLVLALGIGTTYFLYRSLGPQSTGRMTGDFRIAVAGFVQNGQSDDPGIGAGLAQGLYLRLVQTYNEIDPGFTVTIWGPDQIGMIKGQNRDERADSAAQIAKKVGADVVVYGMIDIGDVICQVSPEFYVSIGNFYQAGEITGQHELGEPIIIAGRGNIADRIEVSSELTSRVQALSCITVGLAYYSIQDFSEALDSFRLAEDIEGWGDGEGRQVLYLLIGNAAIKSDDFGTAEVYYRRSLELDPAYARGYLGLADLYYRRALQPFEETMDPAETDLGLISLAIATYEQATRIARQPPLADISTKAHFGLGQSYFMRVYAGEERAFDPAIAEFKAVIEEYAGGSNPRVTELAAESHARLGLIYDLSGRPDLAVESYQTAALLLRDNPDRRYLYEERARAILENTQ